MSTDVEAKVIKDSISPWGNRLTTMQVTIHRFVLAEMNTHRVFSRNSASSRAIPVEKQLARVKENPAIPVEWGKNQSGMQANEHLDLDTADLCLIEWLKARDDSVRHVERLLELGLHKQVANRLLEPWMWHTVIVTATQFEGFFDQRCSPLAQPEIRVAAEAMLEVYRASDPTHVAMGEWHLPYLRDEDYAWANEFQYPGEGVEALKKLSVARCARVSYLTQEGVRDPEKDLELYSRLVSATPMHASPLEHVATPENPYHRETLGNFHGWEQFRHQVELDKFVDAEEVMA